MKKYLLILSVILILSLLGLNYFKPKLINNTPNNISNDSDNHIRLVSSQEFSSLIKNGDNFLLDVHIPEQTHIPGTDAFIPFDKILENQDKLPQDKNTPILIYCRSGNMSAQAAKDLLSLGYKHIYDLQGGTNAYKESNVSVSLTPKTTSLGTVIYGDVATTKYTLTNYTPLPLKITRVSTSCGCTKAKVENEELNAYQSTTVNVSFDPAVHKDDTDLGDLSRTIYIETDNPNFPELESTFTATVVKNN